MVKYKRWFYFVQWVWSFYRNVTFRYTLTFSSIKVLKYGLHSNLSIGKNLEELGYNTTKKRNQTSYKNRNYMKSKYVLKSGLHLMRVTGTEVRTLAILEYTTAGIKKKMVWYVRRMLWLKFYVLISGLLIKYKGQNVGYIIQILNKLSWRKYFATGCWGTLPQYLGIFWEVFLSILCALLRVTEFFQ